MKKYQAPLELIVQVNSPYQRVLQEQQANSTVSMNQSYTSYYKIKQDKDDLARKKHQQEIQEKHLEIGDYTTKLLQLKMEVNQLQEKLENYNYYTQSDCSMILEAVQIVLNWVKKKRLVQSKRAIFIIMLIYSRKKDLKWLMYGKVFNLLLQIFEIYQNCLM